MNRSVSPSSEMITVEERRARDFTGIIISVLGLVIIIISLKPDWLGLNLSPGFGFVQLIVFLAGLAFLSGGGYLSLNAIWGNDERSIIADFGTRLLATGYVVTMFAGISDHIGIIDPSSQEKVIYFGPWEEAGFEIGLFVIILGLLMMIPYKKICK